MTQPNGWKGIKAWFKSLQPGAVLTCGSELGQLPPKISLTITPNFLAGGEPNAAR